MNLICSELNYVEKNELIYSIFHRSEMKIFPIEFTIAISLLLDVRRSSTKDFVIKTFSNDELPILLYLYIIENLSDKQNNNRKLAISM